MREAQNLEEAGTRRFCFVDAIRERRGRLGGSLGGGCFAENAMVECPRRQRGRIELGGESGEDVLGRTGFCTGGG